MLKRLLLGSILALPAVLAPGAAMAAPMTDSLMIWQTYNVTPGPDRHDWVVYYTKQYWLNPNVGIYAFYNTTQSGTVRGMYKLPFGDGYSATAMAGVRASGIGNSSAKASAAFKEGPEVALTLAKTFGGGFSVNVLGSYARLWELNAGPAATPNTGEPTNLYFYGANLNQVVAPGTSVSVGVLGNMLTGAWTSTKFHNFGPTLTLTQSF